MSALHALCEGKPSDVHWQQGRSWLLGENGGMGGCRQRHTQSHGYYLWDTFYKSPHSYSKPWRFPAINSACIFWPTLYPALSLHRSFLHHPRFPARAGLHQWTLNQPFWLSHCLMLTLWFLSMTLTP